MENGNAERTLGKRVRFADLHYSCFDRVRKDVNYGITFRTASGGNPLLITYTSYNFRIINQLYVLKTPILALESAA